MTGLWIGLGIAVVGLVGLFYWHLILAEGAYLGPWVVARTYDWVSRRYDAIKHFDLREESWFVASPLLTALAAVRLPLVLDVATGTGRLPLALMRGRFAGQIVGLDLSAGMLRQARTRMRQYDAHVHWIWQDASRLPFDDGSFDAVASLEALEFLPRPREALAEMVRVLAPGGVLMITNRVGREARLLPGRTFSRPAFEQELLALGMRDLDVRAWQVSYDLALARKQGRPAPAGRGGDGWAASMRCPACHGPQRETPAALECTACGRSYPIRDGIVCLAGRSAGVQT